MSTNSTLVGAKQALVTAIANALATVGPGGAAVPVSYAWNPAVTEECVFLGVPQYDATDGFTRTTTEFTSPVAEYTALHSATYRIEGTCWSFRPDLTPDEAAIAEGRVDALWEATRAALAALSWVRDLSVEFRLRAFEKGWAAEAAFTVQVQSILS